MVLKSFGDISTRKKVIYGDLNTATNLVATFD